MELSCLQARQQHSSRSAGKSLTGINAGPAVAQAVLSTPSHPDTHTPRYSVKRRMLPSSSIRIHCGVSGESVATVHVPTIRKYISATLRDVTAKKMLIFSHGCQSFKQATVASFCGCHQSFCGLLTIQSTTI